MKITPILNIKYMQRQLSLESQSDSKNVLPAKNLGLPTSYIPLLNFTGKKFPIVGADFDKKLLNLDGVTCPCCGIKMLSRNKADLLVDRANKISTVKEFAIILQEAEPYMKKPYKLIVKYISAMAKDRPNLPSHDACKMLASGAGKIVKNKFTYEACALEDLVCEGDFSKADKERLKDSVKYLKSIEATPKWVDLRENLMKNFLEMESPKKWLYFEDLKKSLSEAYSYNWVLKYDPITNGKLKYQGSVLKKCLSDSISDVVKYNENLPDEVRFNKILLCQSCNVNPKKFTLMKDNPKFIQRGQAHLMDLSEQISLNKLEGNNSYIFNVITILNKINQKEHSFSTNLICGDAKAKIFPEVKSEYIFSEYEGIPCASCGTITLPHNQKMQLFEEIDGCENLHQLKHLVNMYKAHITPKCQKVLNRFNEILNESPDITEKKLFKKLRKQSGYDVAVDLVTQQINLKKFAKSHEFNSLDQILLVDFMCRLDKIAARCLAGQEFVYDEYDKAVSETLDKMLNPHKKELILMLKENIKTLYVQDILVRPLPIIVEKAGSKAKAMFQNIFKYASLTVDHTNAKILGGDDEYFNKLGYCKDCNHEKSGRHFISWVAQHPEMNENLPKHLKKISEIIKANNLIEFRHYPADTARYAQRLSHGKLDIPTEYDTY